MTNFLFLLGVVLAALLLFALLMAVGLIFRGKTFTSCGCGSITYKGEKIRCPGCKKDPDGSATSPAPSR